MYASIRALFLRELQTRFGHYRIGYIWALIEPSLNIIFMLILFGGFVHRTIPGIEYPVFLINGILPFFVFRKSAMQALGVISANKGLFSYRSVKPIDALIARTFLELVLYFTCYALLSFILAWLGYHISYSNIILLFVYWLLLFIFSLGFASIMLVVGVFSKELNKLAPPIFLILYFVSGAIFPLHRVPEEYLIYFMWNPVAHLLELIRHAASPSYDTVNGTSFWYFLICTNIVVFLGLLLYRAFSRRLVKTK
ncbi:ABC transporter permease [Acinetobacter faecalis]|uniref:ABC transporter permease n=1 Tax=Acinetobacter faecalis TaxID=2665161 RepID=UPI002A90FE51|nr:ABC transporter permease [Acinetobacter faecalis]MDY6530931.1 ABC transporter permease [Acinetobacter faecalis]